MATHEAFKLVGYAHLSCGGKSTGHGLPTLHDSLGQMQLDTSVINFKSGGKLWPHFLDELIIMVSAHIVVLFGLHAIVNFGLTDAS
jgi:hypothetical protein